MHSRFGVLDRYLFKEVMQNWLGATFVMLLVVISSRLVNILADAATGKIAPDMVFQLIAYKVIEMMELVSPMTFMLALVLALGRLYKDSEMSAMMACGVGPKAIYRTIAWQSIPVLLVVCSVAFYCAPWAAQQTAQLKARSAEHLALATFRPGQFVQADKLNAMAYVDAIDQNQRLGHVFVQYEQDEQEVWVTANGGRVETNQATGESFLILEDGVRYQGVVGNNEWKSVWFKEHGIRLAAGDKQNPSLRASGKYLDELYRSDKRRDQVELQWRLSMPLMVVVLAFLALPVSHTSPRKGRFAGLAGAIFLFVLYTNLLTVAKDAVADEKVPLILGLWWVHGVMALIGMVLLKWHFGRRRVRKVLAHV